MAETEIVWVTLGSGQPTVYHDADRRDCKRGQPAKQRIPTIGMYAREAGLVRCHGCIDAKERVLLGLVG